MNNRRTVVRKWFRLSVAAIALVGFGFALHRGYFHDFFARGIHNKTVFLNGPENIDANEQMAQTQLLGKISPPRSLQSARLPTPIGDIFEAFGKPADVEVCGFGVQHVEKFPMGISLPPVTASNETLNTAARNLANSKTDTERALGLYLQAKLAGDAALERAQIQEPGCGQKNLSGANNKPCSADYLAAYETARMAAAKPLIEMARTTTDANVYATAYYFCESAPRDARGACAPISATGWARLDVENMFPQLLARNPGPMFSGGYKLPADSLINDAPLPTALYDKRMPRFDLVVAQDEFKQEPLHMQAAAVQWLMGDYLAPDSAMMSAFLKFCRPAEVSRSARLQACGALTNAMATQGKSFSDAYFAAKFGADFGLPAAQIEKLKDEQTKYYEMLANSPSAGNRYSCEGMAAEIKHFTNMVLKGERSTFTTYSPTHREQP